jgi:serine/threonine protein kinase
MMHSRRAVNQEPIPGYRLLEPLGKGGFGQVWKCEAPGGLVKAVKFIQAATALHDVCAAEQELRALQLVKSIRHPFLLSIERVEMIDGDLVIVMELADRSLHDLLEERRAADPLRPDAAIPRHEVLDYLREAAEVLDLMNHEHGLQHLDVKPHNLFLVGKHVKVADFGLATSLADRGAEEDPDLLGAITPLYAAPETFEGRVSVHSDQYSLAVTYQELVSGKMPFCGRGIRDLLTLVAAGEPDLSPLPVADRPIVARALSKDPRERFESCTAFVEALEQVGPVPPRTRIRARTTEFDVKAGGDMACTAVVTFETPASDPHPTTSIRHGRRSHVLPGSPASTEEDVLASYQLQECLSRTTLGELWRAGGPVGEPCLVRFLPAPEARERTEEARSGTEGAALERLVSIKHALLPPVRLLGAGPGRVALITSRGDGSLADELKECQAAGLPGIPRQELLAWLAHFAQALDELYHRHQIQHLALTPRHLALCRRSPLLLEFGLAELLVLPQGAAPASLNPRYAAVELFGGVVSGAADQYSLALIYQELLVGLHPFRNLNARQMASAKLRGQPELSLLPAPDRAVVTKALSADPQRRFASCREFVLALEETCGYLSSSAPSRPGSRTVPTPAAVQADANDWAAAIEELVGAAARVCVIGSAGQTHYRLTPGVEIEHHTWARLPAGMAKLKMSGFCEQFKGTVLQRSEHRWLVEVPARVGLWQRWLGQTPSMLVEVAIGRPGETRPLGEANGGDLTPLRVRLEPRDCGRARAEQLLAEMGPPLLLGWHNYFSGQSTKRAQERYPLAQAVHVQVMGGVAVTGRTLNVGRETLTLIAPCEVPVAPVKLTINRWASPLTVTAPGRVRSCVALAEGQYEVEVGLG